MHKLKKNVFNSIQMYFYCDFDNEYIPTADLQYTVASLKYIFTFFQLHFS